MRRYPAGARILSSVSDVLLLAVSVSDVLLAVSVSEQVRRTRVSVSDGGTSAGGQRVGGPSGLVAGPG